MSLKDKYLATACPCSKATIPGWGEVNIRSLSLSEMDKLKELAANGNDTESIIWTVITGVADELGNKLFSADDWDKIKDIGLPILNAIVEAVVKVNGYSQDKVEAEKKG